MDSRTSSNMIIRVPWIVSLVFIILTVSSGVSAQTTKASAFLGLKSRLQNLKFLNLESLDGLKKSESLSLVYFYVKDFHRTHQFLREYEESAELLKNYGVTLGVFICEENLLEDDKCGKDGVESNVFFYQRGVELISLELETLFDSNAIISNVLQLLLLEEVPIIQTRLERQGLEKSLAGMHDLIFVYPEAVGSIKHRIFIEIAYMFRDKYKFAVTTNFKSTYGLQDSELIESTVKFAFWTLFCSKSSPEHVAKERGCRSVLYRGETSLLGFESYIRRLSDQTVFYAPREGTDSLFHMVDESVDNESLPVIYLYNFDEKDKKFIDLLDILEYDTKGFAKIVVVDMNDGECKSEARKQGFEGTSPDLSVITSTGNISFMGLKEDWEISSIKNYLRPLVFPEEQEEEEGQADENVESSSAENMEFISRVETQDDQVAKAVFSFHGKELRSVEVPALLKSSFEGAIRDVDLKFVLFYLPFDATSMAFLLDFDQGWRSLREEYPDKDLLSRVNCYDATDLCSLQNITTYPLLKIFQKGKVPQLYEGPLDSHSVIKAAKLLMLKGPIVLETKEEVESFVKGEFPQNLTSLISTSVLLVAKPQDKGTKEVFDSALTQLSTFDVLGTVKENLLSFISDKYGALVPSVVCFNRKDAIQPIKVLDSLPDVSTVVKFVKQAAIQTMPKLDFANFPPLYAMRMPFVILFIDPTDFESNTAMEVVTQIAPAFSNAIFCWMDAQMKSIGIQLLSEYTWSATLPMITVVDHSQGKVFNYQVKPLIEKEISKWLIDVFSGEQEPSKLLSEKKWKAPGEHYDFLAKIDEEKENILFNENTKAENENFDETLKRAQESFSSVPAYSEPSSILKLENEIREELSELHKSRLYRESERSQKRAIVEDPEEEVEGGKHKEADDFIHEHAEL